MDAEQAVDALMWRQSLALRSVTIAVSLKVHEGVVLAASGEAPKALMLLDLCGGISSLLPERARPNSAIVLCPVS